jgi:hypothetical protein
VVVKKRRQKLLKPNPSKNNLNTVMSGAQEN